MNIGDKQISSAEFFAKFKRTGRGVNAVFLGRKGLMDKIFSEGVPVYCDQSYYVHEQQLDLVIKVGEHYECGPYKTFEDWRDCHYYTEYADAEGHRVWLMTGGRYD